MSKSAPNRLLVQDFVHDGSDPVGRAPQRRRQVEGIFQTHESPTIGVHVMDTKVVGWALERTLASRLTF